uniref:Uncharacterized protein n=1 Tax=Arundo donax TaxID=35708 RepID=A0A0A9HVZ9_ARUDO
MNCQKNANHYCARNFILFVKKNAVLSYTEPD